MICQQLHILTGFECMPLTDDGSLACIFTPFRFGDGDAFALYAEQAGGQLRFFDDGEVLLHFMGRGMQMHDQRRTKFIRAAGEPHGVHLNDDGILEIWTTSEDAPRAFAGFLSAVAAIAAWERDHQGAHIDAVQFVQEVEQLLRAWRPESSLTESPEFRGITGQTYALDLMFEGRPVAAVSAHHSSVGGALRRLIDIKSLPLNADLDILVVIDDRTDSVAADREAKVLNAVAKVMPMTTLEMHARMGALAH